MPFLLKGSAQIENGHNQNMLPRETSKPLENMNPALVNYYNFKLKFVSFEFVALVAANQLKLQILSASEFDFKRKGYLAFLISTVFFYVILLIHSLKISRI